MYGDDKNVETAVPGTGFTDAGHSDDHNDVAHLGRKEQGTRG
jgi:hypothetical protein